ncbi:hypothetical protein QWZ14_27080 [Paeniroseomonas aquatica]|uniref:Uncharacterized protein n=1 Tax=Paeniroseomonas aquatica TaxID=373043 RepID=A0ABT8AES4_9PROT|nr:hypothetical protein [Paeniroseomonas aquatica]MDN3568061.1 hypothetical protein [Paeniroseomonas aquatica]
MRIPPVAPAPRPWFFGATEVPFTPDSPLQATILRMINTNSLAAFTSQVAPARPAEPVRNLSPGTSSGAAGIGAASGVAEPAQRRLEAVPAAPPRPLPRGSLLDLRV